MVTAKPSARDLLHLVGESTHYSNGVWGDVSMHSSKGTFKPLLYAFFSWTFFDDSLYLKVKVRLCVENGPKCPDG